MPVPTQISDLSPTAAINSPAGSDNTFPDLDNHLRAGYAFIRQIHDGDLSDYFKVTPDGRVYGTALHNNAGAVTGATNQYIASGTYTPTLANTTNIDSSTASPLTRWMRVGNVVSVSGQVAIDVTAAAAATSLFISIPIASTIGATSSLSGTAARLDTSAVTLAGLIYGETSGNRARLDFYSDAIVASRTWMFTFSYVVV